MMSGIRVIQVTNVSPSATVEQMKTLFEFLGSVEDIVLVPSREESQPQICFAKYEDESGVAVAQHLTNTVFVDRALIVVPAKDNTLPDEAKALQILLTGGIGGGLSILGQLTGSNTSFDATLAALGLPQPPQLSNVDPSKIEEIRRTIYVGNLDSSVTAEQLLTFFQQIGEVKYVRMAGDETQPTRFAFVEFSDQMTVAKALTYNGVMHGGRPLKINHSNNAIVKPPTKSNETTQREMEEAMKRVRDAQALIQAAIDPVFTSTTKEKKRSRSRSKRRSRSRSRKRSRSRRRSRSRHRTRTPPRRRRSHSRKRSRSRRRTPTPPRRRSPRKRSKTPKRRSRTPRRRSRSPRKRSRTPRRVSRSPKRRPEKSRGDRSPRRSKSPKHKSRSKSRDRSRTPPRGYRERSRGRSRERKRRSYSRSPPPPPPPPPSRRSRSGSVSPRRSKHKKEKKSKDRERDLDRNRDRDSRSKKHKRDRDRDRKDRGDDRKDRGDDRKDRGEDRRDRESEHREKKKDVKVKRDYDEEEQGFDNDKDMEKKERRESTGRSDGGSSRKEEKVSTVKEETEKEVSVSDANVQEMDMDVDTD